ncbi:MAG: TVP38/TMEM64 family protein, partial [Tissierella sp.]|uniref:TVP38/TMEM64 family protein n=1 Tax=Tissierella sp. TaxID=41274 RepID=UPI003F9C2D80
LIKKDLVLFNKDNKLGGILLILMLRLIPLFPFKVVSYSAGLSDIRLRDFSIATVIGSLPGIIVYTNLGDKTNEAGSKGFYQAIIMLILLFIVSFIIKGIYKKRSESII